MTLEELYLILCKTGYPTAYEEHTPTEQAPYVTFAEMSRETLYADDEICMQYKNVRVSLFTHEKDPAAEQKVEAVLLNAGLIYDFYDIGCVGKEKVHETDYEIQI